MKIFNAVLAIVCFSSLVYADDSSTPAYATDAKDLTDIQKVILFSNIKDSLTAQCVKDYSNKTTLVITREEIKAIKEVCSCMNDKIAEKAGGVDFFLNNTGDIVGKKLGDLMHDKNTMDLIYKDCKIVDLYNKLYK